MKVIEQLKSLTPERFETIYAALADQNQGLGPLDVEVAKELKFRPQAIKKLPLAKRSQRAKLLLERSANAELTYEVFGTYLMTGHKQLILDFLNATDVPHEDGMLQEADAKPAVGKLNEAIAELDQKYDPADVTLYLAVCAEQWPQVPEVESMWRMRM